MSSSDSPQRRLSRPIGLTLRPESVAEKSFMESMAGFIHEVVPQAYGGCHPTGEATDPILWAKIEQMDCGDCHSQSSILHKNNLPLLLILGYNTGVQVWTIQASGEAQEILSWNSGPVKVFRLLPNPVSNISEDLFAAKRPIVAMNESTGPASQLHTVAFFSLRTGEQVKTIRFKNPVADILANRRAVVVTFPEKVAVFSSTTFEDQVVLTHCYPPSSSPYSNPVALGSRWLAYAEKRLINIHRCGGGFEGEGIQSYTATVIHAAKSLTKGLREFGETFLTGQRNISSSASPSSQQGPQPGVVTVIDLEGLARGEVNLREDVDGVVAHFVAHANQAISYLAFDPSGTLLFTADKQGHNFHIFRLHPAPCSTKQSAVHHLYTLYRGDTTARVQDVAFATDSRWVAVTTMRGTTHVFPISPYGGSVGVRTHTSTRVVNRLSRFHRSAGLDDTPSSGRSSPVLSGSPNNSRPLESTTLLPYPNPRLPPYPHPTVVVPLVQLRSSFMGGATGNRGIPASPGLSNSRKFSELDDGTGVVRVTCCFAPPRGAAPLAGHVLNVGGGSAAHRDRLQRRTAESLYVMSCHGALVEYGFEPRLATGIPREKICDKSSIELDIVPLAQWPIHRPLYNAADLPPPLASHILSLITNGPESDDKTESPSTSAPLSGKEMQETWLAHVEINTHAGPHRRLWMGPQFTFKTLKRDSTSSLAEIEASEVDILTRPARSNPVNMPDKNEMPIQGLPVITGEGSASSYEQSPRFLTGCGRERYGTRRCDSESSISDMVPKVEMELQLKENLADAMQEMPLVGSNVPEEDDGSERRTHYFMDDERLNWPQTSVSSSNPPASLNIDEDLLDFELESETCLRSPSMPSKFAIDSLNRNSSTVKDNQDCGDKDYSFFVSDEVVSGSVPVDVAFFPDATRSAGESSSNEEDIVTVPSFDQDGSGPGRKSKKNRKKKK
ncbi:breast carcinoma-amplified sequence 3 homolog isoform X3 [Daphnia pulicaria]|nr:breast carcinoma-amplified sequence 3 homolog isoform X3 [Daphnia pulicaria]XP_046644843.1 breast carcinoma-amplified sequence 3 homolog isoform X3 [Daphnia pulicaria]